MPVIATLGCQFSLLVFELPRCIIDRNWPCCIPRWSSCFSSTFSGGWGWWFWRGQRKLGKWQPSETCLALTYTVFIEEQALCIIVLGSLKTDIPLRSVAGVSSWFVSYIDAHALRQVSNTHLCQLLVSNTSIAFIFFSLECYWIIWSTWKSLEEK